MKSIYSLLLLLVLSLSSIAQDQNISNGAFFDGEPYIAINPENEDHLVIAWMSAEFLNAIVIRSKVSFDGGESWSTPVFFEHAVSGYTSADVSMQFDSEGNLYAAYVDYDNITASGGAVYVRKSTDGGLSWGDPVEAISLEDCPDKLCIDRPWIAVDRSGGDYDGTVYVTTMNAKLLPVFPPYNPYYSRSTDGGASFLEPDFLDTDGFLAGSLIPQPMPSPVVGSDGTFHAMYPSYVLTQSLFAQLILASSDDGGQNLSHQVAYQGSGNDTDSLPKKGSLLRVNPANPDHLAYFMPLSNFGDLDVHFIETEDGGETWTMDQRLNDDPIGNGIMQDLIWADFDEDGDLAVCWRDRRSSGESGYEVGTEIWGTVRWADSTSFSPNFVVSSEQADHMEVLNGSGNDFMCVDFNNDMLYAVWGDVRNGVLSIYLNVMDPATGDVNIQEIIHEQHSILEIYPNPSADYIKLKTPLWPSTITFFDQQGKEVYELLGYHAGESIPVEHLKSGQYYVLCENKEGDSWGRLTIE